MTRDRMHVEKVVKLVLGKGVKELVKRKGKYEHEATHVTLELHYTKDNSGKESLGVGVCSNWDRDRKQLYLAEVPEEMARLREFFEEILSDTINLSPEVEANGPGQGMDAGQAIE